MKKRIFSLLLALVMAVSLLPVTAFAADDYELRVLTFEDADYKGGVNFAGGNNWSSLIDDPQYGGEMLYGSSGAGVSSESEAYQWTDTGNTELHNILSEGYGTWCYWSGGHAISNYNSGDIAAYSGFQTQLTVYKKGVSGLSRTGGGHNGSNNFAVHYGYADNSGFGLGKDALPALTFADGKERVIDHMYVTNTTYALNCYIDGNGLTAKIGPDDWVKLVATGYDINGTETGNTSIYLCKGPDNIIMDWTKWDLSSLGKVAKVTFNVTGSSDNGYGFSQPAYFAYDDVAVRFENGSSGEPEQPEATPITAKVGDKPCTVTKVESPDAYGDAYKVTVDSGDAVTIEVKDASFLMVSDANYGYLNEEGANPFTLTAAQLDGVTLNGKQITALVKFTPVENSKIAYLSIMDAMAATTYHFFIERTVKAVPATEVTLDKTTLSLHPTENATLTATVKPGNTTDTVVWASSNEAVATVKDGVVTAKSEGTATITASCGAVKAECVVTVEKPVLATGVTLDKTALTLYEGDAARLTATVSPENTTDKTIVWSSSDNTVATVKDGAVTAVKAGTATITAACGSVKTECAVTVKAPVQPAQKDSVYQIGTAAELVWFAKQVNGGNSAISGVLTADIDLNGINWTPIGNDSKKYAGIFDGAGHAIKNLTIDYQTAAAGERVYLGLFGYVEGTKDNRAAIKNLTVQGRVNAGSEFSVYTGNVAGVVAYGKYVNVSSVIARVNVTVDAKVSNACGVGGLAGTLIDSGMTNCGNEGAVSGVRNLGGLCYQLYAGTMTGCYNTGAVSGSGTYVGGVMGYAKQATIKDVYNAGAVSTAKNQVGGLVGVMENSSLTNGYNTGKITVSEAGGNAVGAAVGWGDGTISNIYYLEGTSEKGVGRDGEATVKTANELKALAATLGSGFKRDLGGVNSGYPVLSWQTSDCKHTGDTEIKDAKEATCTENGYTGDTYCKDCGAKISTGKVISAAGHTGGKATCKDKAVCDKCHKAYGQLDKDNHAGLKKVGARDATTTLEGNIEYWHCSGCGKYYSNAAATKEIAQADTVIPKKTNTSGTGGSSGTGSANTGGTKTDTVKKKGVKSSRTGDTGIALYAAMSLLSLTGGALVMGRKRKTH